LKTKEGQEEVENHGNLERNYQGRITPGIIKKEGWSYPQSKNEEWNGKSWNPI